MKRAKALLERVAVKRVRRRPVKEVDTFAERAKLRRDSPWYPPNLLTSLERTRKPLMKKKRKMFNNRRVKCDIEIVCVPTQHFSRYEMEDCFEDSGKIIFKMSLPLTKIVRKPEDTLCTPYTGSKRI